MTLSILLLIIGITLLLFAADLLVRGASSLAQRFNISPLVVGLTIVAFGTSAPELFVSITAALKGSADVAIGNVLGSNVFNILVIVGIASLFSPIQASREIIYREMPIMLFATGAFCFTAAFLSYGIISSVEGAVLFSMLLLYLGATYYNIHKSRTSEILEETIESHVSVEKSSSISINVLKVIVGLAGLIFGSNLIVENAIFLARSAGISEFIIGVTLIAGGTSLPELATTALAAARKQHELAIGNAVGSNIFNVFCVIGLTAFIQPLSVNERNINFDFPIMFACCLLVWIILLLRKGISRSGGLALLAVYGCYVALLILKGASS